MKFSRLAPDLYVPAIIDIPLRQLASQNKKAMVFDLDNTITEWNNPEIKKDVIQWFYRLREYDFTACLVSNNNGPRVMDAAKKLGIPYVAKATKPRRRAFQRALDLLNTSPEETVVVGDQIFTDIWGGNRMGIFTILVNPISVREYIGTRFMRRIERFALKRIGITKKL